MFVTRKALNPVVRATSNRSVRHSFVPRVLKFSFPTRSRRAVI